MTLGHRIQLKPQTPFAFWWAQRPEFAKVQLSSLLHTNDGGLPQPGWFMVSNPVPGEVLCIPWSIQTLSPTGWVDLQTMSATNDPFTYDPASFRFDRALKEGGSFGFAPAVAVSNEAWRVTVQCVARTSGDRLSDAINSNLLKYFPRPGVSARSYGGRTYYLYSSEP